MKWPKPSVVPAVLWLLVSTFLLTIPGSAFPKEDWLSKIWFDKWVHLGMFSIMVLSWCWAIHKKPAVINRLKKIFMMIAVACMAYGVVIEFIQHYFIPNRGFDYGDIIADAAGCGLGLLFSTGRYIKK